MATPTPPALEDQLGAFIDAHVKVAVKEAITEAMVEEGVIWQQFTAWANGWAQQLRIDYSPGGVLAQSMKDAVHSVKLFVPEDEPKP